MAASAWAPGGEIIVANAEQGALIQKFSATPAQTVFPLTQFNYVINTGSLRVYRNGVKLEQSSISEDSATQFSLVGIVLGAGEIIEATAVLGSQDAVIAAAEAAAASAALAATTLSSTVKKTSDTGAFKPPVGTTAERDAVPAYGDTRVNSDLNIPEWWNGTNWIPTGGGQMLGQALIKAIHYNNQIIDEDLTVKAGTNGGSFGPVTINNGRTVTIESGAVWSII